MKGFLSIILAIFFVVSPTIVKAGNYYPNKTTVYYQQGQYYYNSNHDIGTSGAGQEFRISRSRYVFDLTSIPTNATISQVILHYSVSGYLPGTRIFKITNITNTASSPTSAVYQNINSTVLFSNILYNSSSNLSSTALYNLVMSKRGNYLYLGALSHDENSSNTYADVDISISLSVVVSITADNNFIAEDDETHGKIGVGTNPNLTAPFSTGAVVGDDITLSAISQQTNNQGKQMVWAPTAGSNWKRNGLPISTEQTYSFYVSLDDDDKTFMANFLPYTTNGQLSSSETWYDQFNLTGDVIVPNGYNLILDNSAVINLGNHSIISTGGNIIDQGATINGPAVKITTSGVLKGIYPSVITALNAAAAGQIVSLNSTGTYYVASNATVNSGVTLSVSPGTNISFSNNCKLTIAGKLSAIGTSSQRIIFTSVNANPAAGDWQGIRFMNGNSGSVMDYCEISYAQNGIYADNTNIEIKNSLIHHHTYDGVCSTNGGYIFLQYNTISNAYFGIESIYNSSVYLGKSYYQGGNRIHHHTTGLYCAYYSYMFAGRSDWYPCVNSVYNITGSYLAIALVVSEIKSEVVWWGTSSPASTRFVYNNYGGIIDYTPWLSSDPGYGSPLSKSNAAPPEEQISINLDSPKGLYEAADYYDGTKDAQKSITYWKQIIEEYPASEYASKSLVRLYHSSPDKISTMQSYLTNISGKEETPVMLQRKALLLSTYIKMKENDIASALTLSKEMIEKFPDSEAELYGLYLVSLYSKEKADALSKLKNSYPATLLTCIAREYNNEEVEWEKNGINLPKKTIETENVEEGNEFTLFDNYPNPFNPSTSINYALPYNSSVNLIVYDVMGREIRSFKVNSQSAGKHSIMWDGRNANGVSVASGIYLYRISIKSLENNEVFEKTAKMLLLK